MNKIKKMLFIVLGVTLLIIVGYYTLVYILVGKTDSVKKVEVVDNIEAYGYELHDNETSLYNGVFDELKTTLNAEKIDTNKYAELIAKLYIIDFYTLDNKITNHDIGGIDFWYPDYVENFKEKAENTIYKYIQSNVYGDRDQELPIVKSIELTNITSSIFEFESIRDDKALVVELTFDYEKDLGYPKKATITIIHKDKMLYIVEVK